MSKSPEFTQEQVDYILSHDVIEVSGIKFIREDKAFEITKEVVKELMTRDSEHMKEARGIMKEFGF